ncbi:hypothetical protein F511_44009 [Dorcoceras hygrometricum]|uniref:Uncharacterized protein n=1 Tax=Dorcoceras hygrometricum TaxID=472368 RepID=A0A2Z7BMK0_9LAMI|nr:hypothetical protein F511_44009 [Dorcoceras hygrometricum]
MLEQHEDQAQCEEQFKCRIKSRAEAQNAQVQAQIKCSVQGQTSWKVSRDRRASSMRRDTGSRCPPWTRENLHAGRALEESSPTQDGSSKKTSLGNSSKAVSVQIKEQTNYQLVKDKPAGHNLQEQTMREDHSPEDDEDQLERRSADKSKLLKSGCKREKKK